MTDNVDCTCPRVTVGRTVTELRNWSGDCPAHGWSTDYYRERCATDDTFRRWTDPERLPW